MSRLARNSTDWHRLLEICALSDTLILDEDGIYDPAHFNDRLLLGLKGTMSEAELHILKARLQGGLLNKARRGELALPLPVGLIYNAQNKVTLDPDQRVQQTLTFFFQTYQRTGSATAIVKAFRAQQLQFPRRIRGGPNKGELVWAALGHSRALQVLHNPRLYRRLCVWAKPPADDPFQALRLVPSPRQMVDCAEHASRLSIGKTTNRMSGGCANRRKPWARSAPQPRSGRTGTVQGLVVCGRCGSRMTLRYHVRQAARSRLYVPRRGHPTGGRCAKHPRRRDRSGLSVELADQGHDAARARGRIGGSGGTRGASMKPTAYARNKSNRRAYEAICAASLSAR